MDTGCLRAKDEQTCTVHAGGPQETSKSLTICGASWVKMIKHTFSYGNGVGYKSLWTLKQYTEIRKGELGEMQAYCADFSFVQLPPNPARGAS